MVEPLKDLGSADFFFFNSIGKTKIQLGKPKTPAKKEELKSPGNYPDHKVKTGNRASSI